MKWKFPNKAKVDFTLLRDGDGQTTQDWQVSAYPTSFLGDMKGEFRYVAHGARKWDAPDQDGKPDQQTRVMPPVSDYGLRPNPSYTTNTHCPALTQSELFQLPVQCPLADAQRAGYQPAVAIVRIQQVRDMVRLDVLQ